MNIHCTNYINSIKQIDEQRNINLNNIEITFNSSINNLKYIKDFELIDKEFASFLKRNFNHKINIISVKYN